MSDPVTTDPALLALLQQLLQQQQQPDRPQISSIPKLKDAKTYYDWKGSMENHKPVFALEEHLIHLRQARRH